MKSAIIAVASFVVLAAAALVANTASAQAYPSKPIRLIVPWPPGGGTTPALGVVINAVVDALSDYGVRHIEMPATAKRVWRAICGAQTLPPSVPACAS